VTETPDSIETEPAEDATDPAEPRLPQPRLLRAFDIRCEVVSVGLSKLLDKDDRTTRIED
jgi:hypothetical protein